MASQALDLVTGFTACSARQLESSMEAISQQAQLPQNWLSSMLSSPALDRLLQC